MSIPEQVSLQPRRCQCCQTDRPLLEFHYGAAAWRVCEECGLAERVPADNNGEVLGEPPRRFARRYSAQTAAQLQSDGYVLRLDDKSATLVDQRYTRVFVEESFWRRSDAVACLRSVFEALPAGTPVAMLAPLSGGRLSTMANVAGLIGDGSLAYRFRWQTFFLLCLTMGLTKIWRSQAETTSQGIYLITGETGELGQRPMVSVIMPVYNERKTVADTLSRVSNKLASFTHFDSEIVLVESNSTDGTSEIVHSLANIPNLHVICQTTARGKGYAVREGISRARGSIIIIQDADDEYSVDDYDHLIGAVLQKRSPFVLGARDTSAWKMRAFENASAMSFVYNLGHVVFTSVLNALLGTRLHDPFTMYKVFYKECLYGLTFTCNRFDFDHELVIKLVRKGFIPIELPAKYSARSHAEGKKVSIAKDGIFWLWTDVRLRFEELSRLGL